jgi:hypothetical protein
MVKTTADAPSLGCRDASFLFALFCGLPLTVAACTDGSSADNVGAVAEASTEPTPAQEKQAQEKQAQEKQAQEKQAQEAPTTSEMVDQCSIVPKGNTSFVLEAEGPAHGVLVYVPTNFDGLPLPVVLNWHGLGSNGGQQSILSYLPGLFMALPTMSFPSTEAIPCSLPTRPWPNSTRTRRPPPLPSSTRSCRMSSLSSRPTSAAPKASTSPPDSAGEFFQQFSCC